MRMQHFSQIYFGAGQIARTLFMYSQVRAVSSTWIEYMAKYLCFAFELFFITQYLSLSVWSLNNPWSLTSGAIYRHPIQYINLKISIPLPELYVRDTEPLIALRVGLHSFEGPLFVTTAINQVTLPKITQPGRETGGPAVRPVAMSVLQFVTCWSSTHFPIFN